MTRVLIALFSCSLLLSACSSPKRSGGYYKDDGPGRSIPANIAAIPDAVPRIEAHAPANMRPYSVFGKRYVPITAEKPFRQNGIASWYGRKFHGNKTANGETYDMYAMTAAHPTLPLPSYARVTHARTGKSVVVRINDRGPFHASRIIDLSYVAAAKLDLIAPGSGPVIVEAITHDDIRRNAYQRSPEPAPTPMPIPIAPPASKPPVLTVHADTTQADTVTSGTAKSDNAPDYVPGLQTAVYSPGAPAAAHPVADRPAAHTSASTGGEQVFLQYGAFSAPENAYKLADSLNREIGHIEHRQARINNSADLYRVRIGPYDNRAQAVNAALRIQSLTGREASYATDAPAQDTVPDRDTLSL